MSSYIERDEALLRRAKSGGMVQVSEGSMPWAELKGSSQPSK